MSKVDFNDAAAIEQELAAVEAEATESTATEKVKKPKKPRMITVSYTADKNIKAGETIEFQYEVPVGAGRSAANAGIPVTEMTEEQLKIEYRNANSVLYKTTKKGGDATKAQARVDAVLAIMNEKGISPSMRKSAPVVVDAKKIAELIATGAVALDDVQAMLNSYGSDNA